MQQSKISARDGPIGEFSWGTNKAYRAFPKDMALTPEETGLRKKAKSGEKNYGNRKGTTERKI